MGSSLHNGPVGEPGREFVYGTFERKRKCVTGFFFLGPREH